MARLELSTAEAGAFISRPRQSILREVYLVAKEEEKRRKENDLLSDLIVHLPHIPVSPSAVSPETDGLKRSHSSMDVVMDKENVPTGLGIATSYGAHAQKRMKSVPRLAALQTSTNTYEGYSQPFTFSPTPNNSAWREPSSAGGNAYPYSHDAYAADYSRSPNPEAERYHPNHLAPILSHHHSHSHPHSPLDSPAFPHSAAMSNTGSNPGSAYYSRGNSYMQQQQMDYLHTHASHSGPEYDYGSPYLTNEAWGEGAFTAAA